MSTGGRRGKVSEISAISPVSASSAVDISHTTSILSDPNNAWIAKRQSAMTAAIEKRPFNLIEKQDPTTASYNSTESQHRRLSGENERIGKADWDENTPFGKHMGYL